MKKSISKNKLREFALLIGFGFPIILGLIIPLLSGHQFRIWTLWVSIAALLIGFLKPLLLYYPYKLWMAIGNILGYIEANDFDALALFMASGFVMSYFSKNMIIYNLKYQFLD